MTHPDDTPGIALEGVSATFGSFTALSDVDLTVSRGERVVVCGPSGSGKSTLIRCINGLQPHSSGRITVEGMALTRDARAELAVRRTVAMVFQSFNLFPHLTVLENCILGPMRVNRLTRAEATALAQGLLDRVRIADQAVKYPSELSGGQQQRVAIARALCMRPKVMLLDEPTSALDPEMVREVLDTVLELAADGMTMLCVTHEMSLASAMADRVVFMDQGRIAEIGEPDRFFLRPQTERARAFLTKILHRGPLQ
jgi:ABC-type polar amino acid transport system ATPase subunit